MQIGVFDGTRDYRLQTICTNCSLWCSCNWKSADIASHFLELLQWYMSVVFYCHRCSLYRAYRALLEAWEAPISILLSIFLWLIITSLFLLSHLPCASTAPLVHEHILCDASNASQVERIERNGAVFYKSELWSFFIILVFSPCKEACCIEIDLDFWVPENRIELQNISFHFCGDLNLKMHFVSVCDLCVMKIAQFTQESSALQTPLFGPQATCMGFLCFVVHCSQYPAQKICGSEHGWILCSFLVDLLMSLEMEVRFVSETSCKLIILESNVQTSELNVRVKCSQRDGLFHTNGINFHAAYVVGWNFSLHWYHFPNTRQLWIWYGVFQINYSPFWPVSIFLAWWLLQFFYWCKFLYAGLIVRRSFF